MLTNLTAFLVLCLISPFTNVSVRQPLLLQVELPDHAASIKISFEASHNIFPREWQTAPIFAHAEPLSPPEAARSTTAVRKALRKYPESLLIHNLHTVYVVCQLQYYQTAVSGFGCQEDKSIYVSNNGIENDYQDIKLEMEVHHELAHLLVLNNSRKFSSKRWDRLNPPDFRYDNGGLEYTRKNLGNKSVDEDCFKNGFVNNYAMSDIDEDFASTVEVLFSGNKPLWLAIDQYDVLRSKVKMVIAFYHSLNKELTEPYFRSLVPSQSELPGSPRHYNPGDNIPFPNGGTIIYPPLANGGPPTKTTIPKGGSGTYPVGGSYTMNPPD